MDYQWDIDVILLYQQVTHFSRCVFDISSSLQVVIGCCMLQHPFVQWNLAHTSRNQNWELTASLRGLLWRPMVPLCPLGDQTHSRARMIQSFWMTPTNTKAQCVKHQRNLHALMPVYCTVCSFSVWIHHKISLGLYWFVH